jgi:WD40 repeat protein
MELADDLATGTNIDPQNYQPRTLASEVALKGPLPTLDCIRIGIQLCKALAFVHERGLIHRDVKPSNIIFIENRPKLADIGLIIGVDEAKTYVGTEGFIAPEGPNSTQSDIYSLGKLLYEISTGMDRNDFPALPNRGEFSEQFLDLNEVLVKACHTDLKRRYGNALAMAADLELIGTGKSVRRLHYLEAKLASIRRSGAVLAAIVALGGAVYYQANQSWQRTREQKAALIGGKVAQGTILLQQGNLLAALPSFVDALELDKSNPTTRDTHRLRIGAALASSPGIARTFHLPDHPIRTCAIYGNLALASVDRKYVQIFDLETGEALSKPLATDAQPQMAAFLPGGTAILTANWDETVRIIDWRTGEKTETLEHPGTVFAAGASPDGRTIISGCQDGSVFLWDRQTHSCQELGRRHRDRVFTAKFSPTGQFAVTASADRTACVWDMNTRAERCQLKHSDWIYGADFSPDERLVATASYDREVKLWDARTGSEIEPSLRHDAGVHAVQFSPDGRLILTAGLDGTARLWETKTHHLIEVNHTLRHRAALMDCCFGGSADQILTAASDGTLTLWDFSRIQARPSFLGKATLAPVRGLLTSPDGLWQAQVSGSQVNVCHSQGPAVLTLKRKPALGPVQFNSRSTRLFAVDGTNVYLVDLARATYRTLLHPHEVTSAEFSPDGSKLVCASTDTTFDPMSAQLWNALTGAPIGRPLHHDDGVRYAAFSPDSKRVVTASEDFSALIWDADSGKQLTPKLQHHEKVNYAAFAASEPWVVTGSDDGSAVVWDIKTGDQLTPPFRHRRPLARAEFSDHDTALVTTDEDGNQWKWQLQIERRSVRELLEIVRPLAGISTPEQ